MGRTIDDRFLDSNLPYRSKPRRQRARRGILDDSAKKYDPVSSGAISNQVGRGKICEAPGETRQIRGKYR